MNEHSSEEPNVENEPCSQCGVVIGFEGHAIIWGPCDACGFEHAKGAVHYAVCARDWWGGEPPAMTRKRRAGLLGLN